MKEIEIIKPDDWHVHFRDNEMLKAVVPETTRHFSRAIIMPNLTPPILTGKNAIEYKKRIEDAVPENKNFVPLMTLYLTENTDKNDLKNSYEDGSVFAAKLYPAGVTTNSESGVKNINNIMDVLETMSKIGMPLLIHGEVTDHKIDIFDREKIFIDTTLDLICHKFPNLKITLEHITTKEAVLYIKDRKENLAASITPHHLALNRNAIFHKGINPHNYCLPILKRETHRQYLINAATSGNPKFFLGSDTAPHLKEDKESDCGCAGIFNSTNCMAILAEIFDINGKIEMLENFTSINGAKHYNYPTNKETLKLKKLKNPIKFEKALKVNNQKIIIFQPNFPVYWHVYN